MIEIDERDALVVVDVQNTFCPGGTLPVRDGDAVVAPLNRVMPRFGGRVWATQDWHPADHCSFDRHGGPWPPARGAGNAGRRPAPGSRPAPRRPRGRKGDRSDRDAYSGFDGTDLAARLRAGGVTRVFVGGLATDYCVKATALDARNAGFGVVVLTDACRAVDVAPGDGSRAFEEMRSAGCRLATTDEIGAAAPDGVEERAAS
jgi:nicotinamidase/pyrazinamidase